MTAGHHDIFIPTLFILSCATLRQEKIHTDSSYCTSALCLSSMIAEESLSGTCAYAQDRGDVDI